MGRLQDKRVVITRPRDQAQPFVDLLAGESAVPILIPVIATGSIEDPKQLDVALQNLADYDWLVLTSVNGVQAVWERFEQLGVESIPKNVQIACIGPKTEAALAAKGIRTDFVPNEFVAEAILPGLGDVSGKRVLLTRADIARPDLPEAIGAGGGIADDITAYRTLPSQPEGKSLAALREGVDILTFTSPSTVENFVEIVRQTGLDPLNLPGSPIIACIGPITANAAAKLGFVVDILPADYTIEGLMVAMISHFEDGNYVPA